MRNEILGAGMRNPLSGFVVDGVSRTEGWTVSPRMFPSLLVWVGCRFSSRDLSYDLRIPVFYKSQRRRIRSRINFFLDKLNTKVLQGYP